MKPSARLINLLKSPIAFANALDWKKETKRVATLHIGRDRIGVAIASHPEFSSNSDSNINNHHSIRVLPPVQLQLVTKCDGSSSQRRRALAPPCVQSLESVCDEHEVGSFIVLWPVQKEGRAGASCGKVLHTLESLIAESDAVLTKNRPICLWTADGAAAEHSKYAEDEWGRSAVYSRNSQKTMHRASQEQYCFSKGSSQSAVEAYEAFCRKYWPDVHATTTERYAAEAAAAAAATNVRQAQGVPFAGNINVDYSHQRMLSMQLT